MKYDKKKYEQLINDSPLFSLDKETEYTAFKRESYRMVEYLYCYLLSMKEEEYEPYGAEIVEVAKRCINSFDKTKGIFLHYFNSSWKTEYLRICGAKQKEEKYRGLHITNRDVNQMRKYMKLVRKSGMNVEQDKLYEMISEAMEIPMEKVIELAELSQVNVCGDSYTNDEGVESSLWDQIQGEENIASDFETVEKIEEILDMIEAVFSTLQMRQKPIISDIITSKICSILAENKIKKYSFINESILEDWRQTGSAPTQKEIAQKYDRSETSISRTINEFLIKIRGNRK